jgi:hypothetical protein
MKKLVSTLAVLAVATALFCPPSARAGSDSPTASKTSTPGVQIAQTLSTITGVAISPLLGVSAVGCYQYYQARTAEQRAQLPWFAHPWFWMPAFLLLAVCFVKDTAGVALPSAVKKPFDAIDAVEHKISGLVAAGAFVPIMVNIIHEANSTGAPGASLGSLGLAAMDAPTVFYDLGMVPLAIIAFFIVFLASNAINILILLSPFTTVDLALKTFRTAVLGSVVVSAFINPWLGALWALVLLLISYLVAGWSFRLSFLGSVFLWEFFTGGQKRFRPDAQENTLFLGRQTDRVPTRTYGRLARNENGELVFRYRPWLVLPRRTLVLPAGNYAAGRGLFYSEIMRIEGDRAKTVFLLPPRYRGHEDEIARIYHFAGTREVGIRAAWAWFKSLFTGSRTVAG